MVVIMTKKAGVLTEGQKYKASIKSIAESIKAHSRGQHVAGDGATMK